MPKMKSNRGAAKRFKRTGGGRYKHAHSMARHKLTKKASKRAADLRRRAYVSHSDQERVERLLPYS